MKKCSKPRQSMVFHIFNVHCHCGARTGEKLTYVCATLPSPVGRWSFWYRSRDPLVTLCVSLSLRRGTHFDIACASFSSLCLCQIAFVVGPCWVCQCDLVQRSWQGDNCREHVQRPCKEPCTETLYRDLVQRSCAEISCRDLAKRSPAEILPRDLVCRAWREIQVRDLL